MIDLHCHSHFSDGMHSPKELIEKAVCHQVRHLALTDHDTIEGLLPLRQAAIGTDVSVINGIELSTRWKKHDIHILGLHIQETPAMLAVIAAQSEARVVRAKAIGAALSLSGIKEAYAKATALAGHARAGRPHFAKVLINEGRVRDMQAAFKQYLGQGRGAYVMSSWISVADAVAVIVQSGGMAVIAHPFKYGLTRSKLHALILDFKAAGGAAIEVVSGDTTTQDAKELAGICMRFELLASSGSDFHGDGVSRVALGKQAALPLNCTLLPLMRDKEFL